MISARRRRRGRLDWGPTSTGGLLLAAGFGRKSQLKNGLALLAGVTGFCMGPQTQNTLESLKIPTLADAHTHVRRVDQALSQDKQHGCEQHRLWPPARRRAMATEGSEKDGSTGTPGAGSRTPGRPGKPGQSFPARGSRMVKLVLPSLIGRAKIGSLPLRPFPKAVPWFQRSANQPN